MTRKFGIDGLDDLMGGGFEETYSIAILGEPGTNRDLFAHTFTESGVKENEPTLYFCTYQKPVFLRQDFEKLGLNESDHLEVIDCYSWRLRKSDSKEKYVMKSSNLNEFLNLYKKSRESVGNNGRSVISSLINLVDFESLSAINNLLQILLAEEQDGQNSVLISITPGYREKIIDLVESYVNGFIELKRHRGSQYLKVHWMSGDNYDESWHKYDVEKGVSKDSPQRIVVREEVTEEIESELTKKSDLQ